MRETTTDTCNSSVKAQPLLSMTHMTEKHGKRLLIRKSISGSDRIQDDDDPNLRLERSMRNTKVARNT